MLGPHARKHFLSLKGQEKIPSRQRVAQSAERVSAEASACAHTHAQKSPENGWGVKKGPAFERQRRKMAATTGSGERGRRTRPAEGAWARAGGRGPAKALAAGLGPLRCLCPLGPVAATQAA